ncbi:30S ribosomal protein S3, partial [Candidatus Woesearchaeota archaeon]|nr:30S ribosomal protein S3 [Candidatus Woesearchaeota archaeon]
KNYIESSFPKGGISQIKLKKIPLGEKVIISTSRPSLIVGSKGANIKDLTKTLKKRFHLENPQIEITEVKDVFLDATLVAERIAGSLERFGSARFKSVGHKAMENVMKSGALGVEIILSGKIPSSRATSWRFYQGYLKKCGEISMEGVRKAQMGALLKSGIIGIKVAIMPPDVQLPDRIDILEQPQEIVEEISEDAEKKKNSKKRTGKKKSSSPKKTSKKKAEEKQQSLTQELPEEEKDAVAVKDNEEKTNTEESA